MSTTTKIDAPAGLPYVDITREVSASPDLVYRAYTDPELIARWMGPRALTTKVERYDVRDGGTWRYVQREPDGKQHGFHGVFHGTPSTNGITQTFEYEGAAGHVSLQTVMFEALDGGRTRIHAHAVFQAVEDRDMMAESGMEYGVKEGFERLDELVATLQPVAR